MRFLPATAAAAAAVISLVAMAAPSAARASTAAGEINSGNWSGYAARTETLTDGTFTYATATWIVPKGKAGRSAGWVSVWTGLGGAHRDGEQGASPLVQAGTITTPTGSYAVADVEGAPQGSWGGPHQLPKKYAVKTGDQVTASVTYEGVAGPSNGGHPDEYRIQIRDLRNGKTAWTYDGGDPAVPGSATLSVATPRNAPTSSEWIVEPVTVLGAVPWPLAPFGSIYINGGYVAVVVDGQPVVTFDKYQMPGTTVLGFDGRGGFTVTKP